MEDFKEEKRKADAFDDSLQKDEFESTKAEMDKVREENQRLKIYINQIMKDYQTLQVQCQSIIFTQQEATKKPNQEEQEEIEKPELVSLSLGNSASSTCGCPKDVKEKKNEHQDLTLGLSCKFEESGKPEATGNKDFPAADRSPEDSSGTEENKARQKTARRRDDEMLEQNNNVVVKKPRVSVRARCDAPTMNDGCQWRKYGQKISKGNPCPRAYYRCTFAPSCPVKKHVQRCLHDMSVLITTYEGIHNHPLPILATAMASTTAAAASMLLSGPTCSTTTTANNILHGLKVSLPQNSNEFHLRNSSISQPTVTIELANLSPESVFSHLSSISAYPFPQSPRDSSKCLNFGDTSAFEPNNISTLSWGSTTSSTTALLASQGTDNISTARAFPFRFKNPDLETSNAASSSGNIYQSLAHKNTNSLPADTLAAVATKAITNDPSFQSALAAALNSMISSSGGGDLRKALAVGSDNCSTKATESITCGLSGLASKSLPSSTASHHLTGGLVLKPSAISQVSCDPRSRTWDQTKIKPESKEAD